RVNYFTDCGISAADLDNRSDGDILSCVGHDPNSLVGTSATLFHCASCGCTPFARAPTVVRAHAPVSRQTENQHQFVTHRAFTRTLPPSLGFRSVLFTVPLVFVRWRSSEERKQAGNGRKGKN